MKVDIKLVKKWLKTSENIFIKKRLLTRDAAVCPSVIGVAVITFTNAIPTF